MAELATVDRLRLFDEAILRQRKREKARPQPAAPDRGWTREGLYARGGPPVTRVPAKPIAES